MTNIENMDEQKLSALRVIGFGVIGALWKKKHRYTVLQYKDGTENRAIVLDFHNDIDLVQPLIYGRMLNFRKSERNVLPKKIKGSIIRHLLVCVDYPHFYNSN